MSALSMSIQLKFNGDCDRLPHKDLAERIVKAINDAVREACEQAGTPASQSDGWATHTETETRPFLGSRPYSASSNSVEVQASWGVHLPDEVADAPEVAERS